MSSTLACAPGAIALTLALALSNASPIHAQTPEACAQRTAPFDRVAFAEVTRSAGLADFEHQSYLHGGDGLGGAAWFDFDEDGDLDLYLTNGQADFVPGIDGYPGALFQNNGDGTFQDVAAAKGVTGGRGNSGVIAADLDNDGDQDLFLTGDGGMLGHAGLLPLRTRDSGVVLFENQGAPDYDFVAVDLATAGLGGLESTMSAAFADVDGDGFLDLFVAAPGSLPSGCPGPPLDCCAAPWGPPLNHRSHLFQNVGAGLELRFEEVAADTVGSSYGGALACFFHDYNLDGRPDLFVANGAMNVCLPTPIQLFENVGLDASGHCVCVDRTAAHPMLERDQPWMGFAPARFHNTFDPADAGNERTDFFVSNAGGGLDHALFRWDEGLQQFRDVAPQLGVADDPGPSTYFGWGCTAQDFDLDGRMDLYFTGAFAPYGFIGPQLPNPGQLLLGDPGPVLSDYSAATPDLSARFTSGAAAGDYDGDGRVDLIVVTDRLQRPGDTGAPVLLRNTTEGDAAWITIRLRGDGIATNRDAVGARVRILYGDPAQPKAQIQEVFAGTSFLSMDSKWLTFGLGAACDAGTVLVDVDWPDGPQTPFDPANWTRYGPFEPGQPVSIEQ